MLIFAQEKKAMHQATLHYIEPEHDDVFVKNAQEETGKSKLVQAAETATISVTFEKTESARIVDALLKVGWM